MSNDISLEGFEGHLVSTMEEAEGESKQDGTFRVALLGDWSGRANRDAIASGEELASWLPRRVDRDNLDELMNKLGVRLSLPLAGSRNLSLEFHKLDDFHPDSIFEKAELFQVLRDLRAKLNDPTTFPAAAEEVRSELHLERSEKKITPFSSDRPTDDKVDGSLLDQIISGNERKDSDKTESIDHIAPDLRSFVHDIVRPYLLRDDAEQESLVSALDKAISEQMRLVLHNREFQNLESAWRALHLLVSRIDTGIQLNLYLLDISQEELKAALRETPDVTQSGIYKLLVSNSAATFGGEGWSLLLGNYVVSHTAEDAGLLERVSMIAAAAGAPFIAGASPTLVGCSSLVETPEPDNWKLKSDESTDKAWERFISAQESSYVGLSLPRFLVRLPYGSATEPTEQFEFEEFDAGSGRHDDYLWANPCFAVGYILAQGYSQGGPGFRPEEIMEIEGLPLHVYESEGETTVKPCAEILMTVETAREIIQRGVMPLITMKGTDVVRLGMLQSVSSRRLAGSW